MGTENLIILSLSVLVIILIILLIISNTTSMKYSTVVWRERTYSIGDGVEYFLHIAVHSSNGKGGDTTRRVRVPIGVYYDSKPGTKVLFPASGDLWYVSKEVEEEFLKSSPKET